MLNKDHAQQAVKLIVDNVGGSRSVLVSVMKDNGEVTSFASGHNGDLLVMGELFNAGQKLKMLGLMVPGSKEEKPEVTQ